MRGNIILYSYLFTDCFSRMRSSENGLCGGLREVFSENLCYH
ncbi:hypothetical protein NEIMUCOT_04901 [Neisseria mucosa ATCC 25996]|uniref:Uncharacterized protein n=1 Tax=Neisseria mucosa (strain ATCC 25996 / DSM 4631 / NCTC 10774 / M26) TaxID=546266 RepID=D2ZWA8_NEIM2|nr:hypothetical protein NEIMUCOT_04901 [Neisseria mucosa ATCC 25996]